MAEQASGTRISSLKDHAWGNMAAEELLPHYKRQEVETPEAGPVHTHPAAPSLPGLLGQGRGSGWWLHWFQEAWLGWSSRVHLSVAQPQTWGCLEVILAPSKLSVSAHAGTRD